MFAQFCTVLVNLGKNKETLRLKMDKYIIFERVRTSQDGAGGIMLGAKKELYPMWVREGKDDIETLSVDITVEANQT